MASPQSLILQLLITARDQASDILGRIRESILGGGTEKGR